MELRKLLSGDRGDKKTPQLGGNNPANIDDMVMAGILTKEEGEKAKKRLKEKNKNAS